MTISQNAVKEFLNRDLNSFDWVKDLTDEELDEEIAALDPQPEFHGPESFTHQKASFLIGAYKKWFLFFLEPGGGKTKISLDLLAYHKKLGNIEKPSIVLVPNVANITDWFYDAHVFRPDIKIEKLEGSTKQRLETLEKSDADVFALNYDGLSAMVTTKVYNKKKRKNQMVLDKDVANEIFSEFDGVVFDESTALKNHQSLTFQACNFLANKCNVRYALTGTPFNDPTDLWPQFYAIDRGETLGETLAVFREGLCTKRKNKFTGFTEYHFDGRKKSTLNRMIKNRSILYTEDEFGKMPEKNYIVKHVPMTKEIEGYYSDIREKIVSGDKSYKKMESSFLRLRQLSSGFMGVIDEEDNEKLEFELKQNPKLDELKTILQEMPSDKKVVITHVFIHTATIIHRMLEKMNINYATLDGSTIDPGGEKERFVNDPNCKVMTGNVATMSKGHNLQVANYMVLFESPISLIDRSQVLKRIHRQGQKEDHVFFIDLVMEGSVDGKILNNLEDGKNLFDEIIAGRETV